MSTYGYDDGFNKVAVPTSTSFTELVTTVAAKQAKLNATQGVAQDDCDDLTSTGVYYVPSTADNVPTLANYIVLVFPSDDEGTIITQIAVSTGSTLFYVRTYVNASWTSWNSVASSTQGLVPEVFISSSLPASSIGKNGDTYYYIQNNLINKMYIKVNNSWQENKGDKGDTGNTGATPVIQIGTVTSGSTPSVTVDTTVPEAPVMSFVLPGPVKTLTGSLSVGETTVTISDSSIQTNSMFDIFTDIYGVTPISVNVSTGSMILTFETQTVVLNVKVVMY